MTEQNNAAPHECPQCGEPAYLGFGIPAKCVQKGCLFYDATLWSEWVMELPDVPDPVSDFEDEKTAPYGITFAGVPIKGAPSGSFVVPTLDLTFRDFCSHCFVPVEFLRDFDDMTGSYFSFCPQCGQPNVWS